MFSLKSSDDVKSWADVQDEFVNIIAQLNAWAQQQHNPDGSHSAVTATRLNLQNGFVGELISLPVDPSLFTASSGTWTVSTSNVPFYQYIQVGRLVWVNIVINSSVISGTNPTYLFISLPQFNIPLSMNLGVNNEATQFVGGGFQWIDYAIMASGSDVVTCQNVGVGSMGVTRRLVLGPGPASNGYTFRDSTNFGLNAYCWIPLTVNNAANP